MAIGMNPLVETVFPSVRVQFDDQDEACPALVHRHIRMLGSS